MRWAADQCLRAGIENTNPNFPSVSVLDDVADGVAIDDTGIRKGLEPVNRGSQRERAGASGGRAHLGAVDELDHAEVIAAIVAGLPDSLGGIRMALRIAELARAGLTPDWMPGAVPRCVPRETRENQHGVRAVTEVVGTERVLTRGKWRTIEVLVCPVIWRPQAEQIASARRGYEDWWQALGWVRDGLQAGAMLREVEVMAGMPKLRPWRIMSRS